MVDRYYYSTIIRINYGLGLSPEETVTEILSLKNIPDIIFLLQANLDLVKKRLAERDNFIFDIIFYNYENEVFRYLSNKCDIIYAIDNSNDVDLTVNKISSIIDEKTRIKKR